MTDDVKKILELFSDRVVLAILEAEDRYIVSVCNKVEDIGSATECLLAVDKGTFKTYDYSYFNNRDEYIEACNNVLYKYEELTHWGIKGMRWGVRRYQNPDGSLTAKGRKRYNEELASVREAEKTLKNRQSVKAKLDRLEARKKAVAQGNKELDESEAAVKGKKGKKGSAAAEQKVKKLVKDMSDEELLAAVNRARLEDAYNQLRPEQETGKQSVMKRLKGEVLAPAAINAGRQFVEEGLKKLGAKILADKVDPNSTEAMIKIRDRLKTAVDIEEYKNRLDRAKKDPRGDLSAKDQKTLWELDNKKEAKAKGEPVDDSDEKDDD